MKKLYRNTESKMIGGICSGIADIFSIDPTVVRLIAIFACVVTGFFPLIITYGVGYFIIPEAPLSDSSSKVENEE